MDGHLGKVSGSKDSMHASCTANKVFRGSQPRHLSDMASRSCLLTCWVSTESKKLDENLDLQHASSTRHSSLEGLGLDTYKYEGCFGGQEV